MFPAAGQFQKSFLHPVAFFVKPAAGQNGRTCREILPESKPVSAAGYRRDLGPCRNISPEI
jgi:hypothetical protein